jgi:hypothetical protein
MAKAVASRRLERMATKLIKASKRKKPSSIPSTWAMSNRSTLLSKDNKGEACIEKLLKEAGIPYTREFVTRCCDKDRFIDFVVEWNGCMIAIEVDGKPHMSAKGQSDDRKREGEIIKSGEVSSFVRFSWSQAMRCDAKRIRAILDLSAFAGGVVLMY